MGGSITTECLVEEVVPLGGGKSQIINFIKNGMSDSIFSTHVVHAWNGYGAAQKFLPERLSNTIMPIRGQAVALKKPGLEIDKSLIYYCCPASDEEYMIRRK